MKFIKTVPMATCGLALALAALGNLLFTLENGAIIRYICGALSLIVLMVFASKIFFDKPHAREELKTPVPLSVLPTATMTIMILSTYIRPYLPQIALILWYAALITHIFIMLTFIRRFVIGFQLGTVFPSWFIAGVGIVTLSVTAPVMNVVIIGQIAFYIGLVLYFTIFPLVVLCMCNVKVFPEPARKTVAIFAAPMSLLIVGYFNSFGQQVNPMLVYFMLAIAAASYVYVTVMMFSLLRIKFYPTYSAFTFPYVISAIAFRLGANFLAGRHGFYFLFNIADVTMWIAVVVVVFVVIHYIKFFRFWLRF